MTEGNAPKISVLTPSFQQGAFITEAIESVLAQNDPQFEHFVMDAGSTDHTAEVLAHYPHLIWESGKDRGQSHALNKAFSRSTGQIIGWLNADDAYLPGAFAAVREAFAARPSAGLVYGDVRDIDGEGNVLREVTAGEGGYEAILRYWRPAGRRLWQPAVFMRRSLMEQVGPFREDLHYAMDWEYWLRARRVTEFLPVNRALACNRRHEKAKTSRGRLHFLQEQERIYREVRGRLAEEDQPAEKNAIRLWRGACLRDAALAQGGLRALPSLWRAFRTHPRAVLAPRFWWWKLTGNHLALLGTEGRK